MSKKSKCDCLNWCGDDPWLADGRAEPCKDRKQRDKQAAQAREERARIHGIANTLADSALANSTVTVSAKDMDDIRRFLISG